MNKITSKDLKRLAQLRNDLSALKSKQQQIKTKKKTLDKERYKAAVSEYKQLVDVAKNELVTLEKSVHQTLLDIEKKIRSLKREQTTINKELSKSSNDSTTNKNNHSRLKEIQKELELRHKQQTVLAHSLKEKKAPKAAHQASDAGTAPQKTAKKSQKKLSSGTNPLFIGAALGTIIIIGAITFTLFQMSKTENNSIQQPPVTEETTDPIKNEIIDVNLSGVINGTNVNIRTEPNVTSDAIRQLQKGAEVTVTAKKSTAMENDAVLSGLTQLTMESGKKIKLDAGKGIYIVEERDDGFLVRYPIKDGKTITGVVDKASVKRITGETWYRIRTKQGVNGWMYGKYIDIL
ncbi:MAG: hypothetical protein PF637_09510 [Spirochaetes bacterium]|jgi:myosin heavy subunit|nr:hypothetical protein [Spirochaetota bacterium]